LSGKRLDILVAIDKPDIGYGSADIHL